MGRRRWLPAVQATCGRLPFCAGVRRRGSVHRLAGRGERPKEPRALTNRDPAIKMVTDGDTEPRATSTAGLRATLQRAAIHADGVIAGDDAGVFVAEDRVEIGRPQGHERARRVAGRSGERGVVLRDEAFGEIHIRRRDRRDPRHPQLVDQPVLQRAIEPLTAAPRLRRVRRNVLDPQPRQCPADLRELGLVTAPRAFGVGNAQCARSV